MFVFISILTFIVEAIKSNSHLQIRKNKGDGRVGWEQCWFMKAGINREASFRDKMPKNHDDVTTLVTTDDMWCVSCGRSEEVLWKLSRPHFLYHWNQTEITTGPRVPNNHIGTAWGFILGSHQPLIILKSIYQRGKAKIKSKMKGWFLAISGSEECFNACI